MKIILSLFVIVISLMSFSASSLEKGKWKFVKSDEYCYIGSQAIK